VRIRGTWIALPAFAVAGAVGHTTITSWLAAQEPPPFGYYPPKVSPSQPGLVPAGGIPSTSMEPRTVNGQPVDWSAARPRLTAPIVAGPAIPTKANDVPIRQVGAIEPIAASKPAAPPNIAPPPAIVPPVASAPPAYMPSLPSPKPIPVPAPGIIGTPIAAPKLSIESSLPEPKILEAPKLVEVPKPFEAPKIVETPPPAPRLLSPSGPPVPLSTNMVPEVPAPKTVAPPTGPALLKPAVSPPVLAAHVPAATIPVSGLATKNTPTVVLEAIAPETISVNQPLVYELVVRNTGATAVANVRVEEEPPAGAKFLASEPAAESFNGRLVWSLGGLDAGAEKRIKISVRPADEGEIRSRAVVSFSAATEARVKVTRPKLNLALSTIDTARVGDEIAFTIRVANTGTGPASKMLVQANLTDGLNHAQGAVVETELANLPAGESRTLTLRTLATKAGSQGLALSIVADGNAAETAKATLAVVEPMLAMRLGGPAKCLVRSEPEFKIELTNPGSAATDPVVATAAVPDGFEFVSATESGSFQPTARTVVWKLPALAAGGKKDLALKLRATGIADGSVKVFAQSGAVEPVEAGVAPASARVARTLEAKAEGAIKAEGVPALRFEVIDVEDPVEVGKEAIYEIKVVNQGTAPCTGILVAATLAEGTSATGANGPTQARGQGQQVTFDSLATLAVKQEATFKVKVKGGVAGDQRFRVQVSCDQIRTPVTREESTRFVKD
jgi:uncharacterized repeat protein (TIGR01451 family)